MLLAPLDIVALVWLFGLWFGYGHFADRRTPTRRTLMSAMHDYRRRWMEAMIARENRMVDAAIMGTIMRSVGLFASTTIFIVGGLIAVLGAVDKARAVVSDIPFAVTASEGVWEVKVFTLLVVFVYAFFKFAWSLRQFNYSIAFIGAAPAHDSGDIDERAAFAERAAAVASIAIHSFNQGLRAYYFGLATLTWFIHPGLFMAAALWVVLVLYRREFRSRMLKVLLGEDVKL